MKARTFNIGLVSTAVVLTLAPVIQGFPQWMKPRDDTGSKNAPREYKVYEPPPPGYGGYYTYAGHGPQPTVTRSSSSSISSATSESSGEETSLGASSSGKLLPCRSEVQSLFFAQLLPLSLPLMVQLLRLLNHLPSPLTAPHRHLLSTTRALFSANSFHHFQQSLPWLLPMTALLHMSHS